MSDWTTKVKRGPLAGEPPILDDDLSIRQYSTCVKAEILGENPSNREAALTYVALGFRVLPIRPADKRPLTAHGVKDATHDQAQVHCWWSEWPDAGVGLAMGRGLVAIDIDAKHGGFESLDALERELGALRATWTARTGGGGRHYIYHVPVDCVIRNRTGLRPGVDIRGENGYIVVCPSVHPNGNSYDWECIPAEAVTELAPDWLIALRPKGLGSSERGRHTAGERFAEGDVESDKERERYAYLIPARQCKCSPATQDQLAAIMERHAIIAPGTRHSALLRISADFNRLLEARDKPAAFFKPLLFEWWQRAKDAGHANADWQETYHDDFARLWEKSQDHAYRTPVEQAFARAMSKPLPPVAKEYGCETTRKLIALCREMQATCADADGKWWLGGRSAAVLIGASQKFVSKCLLRLEFDEVIKCVQRFPRGSMKANRYRWVGEPVNS